MPSAPRWSPNVNVTTSGGASVTSGENIVVGAPGTFVGNLSGTADSAGTASAISVTANSTSTSYRIGFLGNSTGETAVHSDGNLTYNPSTNNLTTTTFTGNLSGNASTSTSATSATSASTITTTASSTNTNYSVPFLSSTSGNVSLYNDAGLIYNPSTNVLDVGSRVTVGNYSVRASGNYAIDPQSYNVSLTWSSASNTGATFMTPPSTLASMPYNGLYCIYVTLDSDTFNGADVFGVTLEGALTIYNNTYGTLASSKQNWNGQSWNQSVNYTGYLSAGSATYARLNNVGNEPITGSAVMHIRLIYAI